MAFRYDGQVVFQVQLVRSQEAVPLTRDYMLESERAMQPLQAPHPLCAVSSVTIAR